jgi:hypothetical protein
MVNPEKCGRRLKTTELKAVADREAERRKRLQAIDLIFGMWRGRADIPQDGLAFQDELRDEWKRS